MKSSPPGISRFSLAPLLFVIIAITIAVATNLPADRHSNFKKTPSNIYASNTDSAGELAFSAATYTAGESGPSYLTITRTGGSEGVVTVDYSTAVGTASVVDFTSVSHGTVSFEDGETAKPIRLTINNDTTVEENETFQVILSDPTGEATLGTPAQATVTIIDDDTPQLAGQWSDVSTWPTVPIHMHLLPSGKVAFWDRHNHEATPIWDVTPRLWDPLNPSVFTTLSQPDWDIFCSGHAILADGRVFVAGGHVADFVGAATAGIYDPITDSWTALPDMNGGRWYPTVTILANGDALVIAGTREGYLDLNPLPQIWQVKTGSWRNLTGAAMGAIPNWAAFYPYSYQAPNGKVFIAGPQQMARYLDTSGSGHWTDVAGSSRPYRDYGSSVMYDNGKVLILGGNLRDVEANIPLFLPAASAEVIDLNAPTPAWRTVSPMSVGRRHANATILPDGKVLVTGGSSTSGHDDPAGAVFYAELWDPETENWTTLAGHTRYRGYHSNALLLPDGRVVIAGGGHPDPVGGVAENNAEIYSPPYLFKGARPSITAVPPVVTYGQTFSVQTPDAANIAKVNWIRLASVTHAFNENQRINRLTFSQTTNGLNVTAPANGNLCPPGHYMLFLLNSDGVPSVARIVQILEATVQFNTSAYSINEGEGTVTITVNRVGPTTDPITVQYATSDGTATAGADYIPSTGMLTFNSGEISKSFTVAIQNDSLVEGDETVNVTLNAPGVSLSQQAVVTITDNDMATPPSGSPTLLADEISGRAIAFDSVTMISEPLPVMSRFSLSSDRRTRVMLFAMNIELMPGENPSVITAQAEDLQGTIQNLPVEFVGKVPGFDWLTQINVKLIDELTNAGDVRVFINLRGVPSNKVVLGIRPAPNATAKTGYSTERLCGLRPDSQRSNPFLTFQDFLVKEKRSDFLRNLFGF